MRRNIFIAFFIILLSIKTIYASNIQIVDDANGFRVIENKQTKTQIDREQRHVSDISYHKYGNMLKIIYLRNCRIATTGMVIIRNNQVVFDTKQNILGEISDYMQKIYTNHRKMLNAKGFVPGPEDINNSSNIKETDFAYKTTEKNGKIIIKVNFSENYKKFVIFEYDSHNYRLVQIINNTGIIDQSNCNLGIINDPDGYTNIRQHGSTNGAIVGKVYDGDIFAITSFGTWCRVITSSGISGYMHKSRIIIIK